MRNNVKKRNRERMRNGMGSLEKKIKICIVIVAIIVIANALSPGFLDKIRQKTGVSQDYEVQEVVSMAADTFYDAKEKVNDTAKALKEQEIKEFSEEKEKKQVSNEEFNEEFNEETGKYITKEPVVGAGE